MERKIESQVELDNLNSFVKENFHIPNELSERSLAQAVIDNLPPAAGLHSIKSQASTASSSELRRINALMTCGLNRLRDIPCAGIFMAFLASICSCLSHFAVKLAPGVNSFIIVVFTCLFSLIIFLPVTIQNGWSFFGEKGERLPLLSRAFFGFFNVSLGFAAFTLIPLADATTIISAAPVVVSIFAPCILNESCGLFQAAMVVMTLGGVLLVSQPTFVFGSTDETAVAADTRLLGSILSVISCVTGAFCFISLRKLQRTPSMVVMNAYQAFTAIGCCIALAVMHFTHLTPDGIGLPKSWADFAAILLAALAVAGVQCALTVALKLEEANIVSLTRTSDILISFIIQLIFLGDEKIDFKSYLGAVIVFAGVSLSALRSWLISRPKKCSILWRVLNCGLAKPRNCTS